MWGREERVSVLTAGLVYHKPPSCQYYDRRERVSVSFAQILGRGRTPGPKGRKGRRAPPTRASPK